MKKLKVAQIGTAQTTHSVHIFQTLLSMTDVFEVIGVADIDEHPKSTPAIFSRVPQMTVEEILNYPDLDGVVIECAEENLTKYALMAAEKKIPIQMEKPGGFDDKEFDKLIDTVKSNNTIFSVSYMYRFNPAVMFVKELIESGSLGEIFSVEAQMNCLHPLDFRKTYSHHPSGILYYLGCHIIDLVYGIQGKPKEIIPLSTCVEEQGVYDFGMAAFKYDKGVSIMKTTSAETDGWRNRSLYVCGTKGTAKIFPLERATDNSTFANTTTVEYSFLNENTIQTKTFRHYGRYHEMLLNFGKMIRGEVQNKYSYEYERELHKIILEACNVK